MDVLLVIAVILLSPALLAGSLLFPPYWIGQYRLLRRTGSWALQRERQDAWTGRFVKAIGACYVICAGALLFPGVFPRLNAFLWKGGMLIVFGLIFIDFLVLAAFSPDKAVEAWKAEQPRSVSGPPPGSLP
jgi:hypothetical protein